MYARVVEKKSQMAGGVSLRILLAAALVLSVFALSAVAFASPSLDNGSFVIDEWTDAEGTAILSAEQLDNAYASLQEANPMTVKAVEVAGIPTPEQKTILADFVVLHPEIETVIVDLDESVAPHQAYASLADMGFAAYSVDQVLVSQGADESETSSTYAYVLRVSQGQSSFPAALVVKQGDNVYSDSRQAYAAYDYSQASNWPGAYVLEGEANFEASGSVVFSYDGQGIFLDGTTVDLNTTSAGDMAWYFIGTNNPLFATWIEIAQPPSASIPSDTFFDPTAPPPPASTTTLSTGGGPSSNNAPVSGGLNTGAASLSLVRSDLSLKAGQSGVIEVAEGLQQTAEAIAGLPASEVALQGSATPTAALQAWCWTHFYIVVGMLATIGYAAAVVGRRRAFVNDLKLQEANARIDSGRLSYPMGLAFMKDIFSEDTSSH